MGTFTKFMLPVLMISPLVLSGCDQTPPPSMEAHLSVPHNTSGQPQLTIRSLESEPITINSVAVNAGQCRYASFFYRPIEFPIHLKIGQAKNLYLYCSYDSVVKVDIETDRGNVTYSFK